MAISKCPQCGEMLSTSVTQCIHCGCEVMLCPECGTFNITETESCRECGFHFSEIKDSTTIKTGDNTKSENIANDELNSVITADEAIRAVGKESYYSHKNPFNILWFVMLGITILDIVMCIISMIVSGDFSFSSILACFFIIAACCSVCSVWHSVFGHLDKLLYYNGIRKWKKAHGVDLKKIIEKTMLSKCKDDKTDVELELLAPTDEIIMAQLMDEGIISQGRRTVMNILNDILGVVQFWAFLWVVAEFVLGNLDIVTLISSFSLSRAVVAGIIGIVIVIVRFAVFKKEPKRERAKRKEWVEENFAERVYTNYLSKVH